MGIIAYRDNLVQLKMLVIYMHIRGVVRNVSAIFLLYFIPFADLCRVLQSRAYTLWHYYQQIGLNTPFGNLAPTAITRTQNHYFFMFFYALSIYYNSRDEINSPILVNTWTCLFNSKCTKFPTQRRLKG